MLRSAAVAALLALAGSARAADPPKFDFAKPEEIKAEVVWKASANVGFIYTTGNSNTLTLSGGATISRFDGKNRLLLDLGGAFARSKLLAATDANGNGVIDPGEISETSKVTAQSWMAKFRYDRFFSENNAGYVAVLAASDEPAGKAVVVGGQAGYSRHLYQTKRHDLVAELGYDFSFVDYAADNAMPKSVSIHSLRAFAGYNVSLTADTTIAASIESLFNANPIDTPTGHAGPFEDVRLLGKASLTTKLWSALAFRFSFTAKFDNQPAPLPSFKLPFAAGYTPAADKLDTITEAALIVNFT
jgi:hypothetical protein